MAHLLPIGDASQLANATARWATGKTRRPLAHAGNGTRVVPVVQAVAVPPNLAEAACLQLMGDDTWMDTANDVSRFFNVDRDAQSHRY